jgi:hypothetical protein
MDGLHDRCTSPVCWCVKRTFLIPLRDCSVALATLFFVRAGPELSMHDKGYAFMRSLRSFHLLLVLALGILILSLLRPVTDKAPPAYWHDATQLPAGRKVLDASSEHR